MIAISQPTYLPWVGYFALIHSCKKFVFLDDVQFDRRSWQQRNRILINQKINYLTLPIKKKGLRSQLINETIVENKDSFKKHSIKIRHAYSKARYFKDYFNFFEEILDESSKKESLSETNIFIIKKIAELIDIQTDFKISSKINVAGKKSDKIINLCKILKTKNYLINKGALQYITDDQKKFIDNDINLHLLDFKTIHYNQFSKTFVGELSILDLIFNEGPTTQNILKNSYKLKKIKF